MGIFRRKKVGGTNASMASSLLDEKQKADIIINNIDDGVVLIDADNIIRAFNPGAARLTGWSQEEAMSLDYRSILKFIDEKGIEVDELHHPLKRALTSAKSLRDNTATALTKDNKPVSVDISVSPLLDASKTVNGAVAILRNVNEQRKEEKQRADFISTASHEMRTPVAAIEGYLALSLNDKVTKIDSKARSYLEKAHSSTQHLGKLFQNLLTSAKAEDGRLANYPVVIEFGDFVEKLVDDLRFSAEKKGLLLELLMGSQERTSTTSVDVSKKVVKPLLYIVADPDRLREVITNLFDNAVKYTETGRISIGITGDSSVVQFHISDTGPGIPANDIKHLFQKFYRVDNTSTRTIGGTGLGLYICRKIVELYSGRIWVESEVGVGSTFYINLPRIDTKKATEMMIKEKSTQPIIQNDKL
jgi:two-component system, OmpR family, sensor histidine kinase VicK